MAGMDRSGSLPQAATLRNDFCGGLISDFASVLVGWWFHAGFIPRWLDVNGRRGNWPDSKVAAAKIENDPAPSSVTGTVARE